LSSVCAGYVLTEIDKAEAESVTKRPRSRRLAEAFSANPLEQPHQLAPFSIIQRSDNFFTKLAF
jgi:hypothetical protein